MTFLSFTYWKQGRQAGREGDRLGGSLEAGRAPVFVVVAVLQALT